MSSSSRTVQRRHVFYISGFDPRGPLFYRRLYRTEAAKQARLTGQALTIGPREKPHAQAHSWRIETGAEDAATAQVHTIYEFLRWDDIIRSHWPRNELHILLQYLQVAWVYISSGTLRKVLQTAWPPFLAAFLPLLLLLLVMAGAGGAGLGAHHLATHFQAPWWLAAAAGIGVAAGVLHLGRLAERRFNSYWLLRIFTFTVKQGENALPELNARLDLFAERIAQQIKAGTDDEVLIVGHSTGTLMAVSVMARILEKEPELISQSGRVSLMTLGHCIPMLSLLPQAQGFRQELARVAQADRLDWVDFTAPTDGACFALVDPVAASGIVRPATAESAARPKLLSPRYVTLFTPATYARIRRDWYRNHFQYLMAGEQAGDYDYFAITAGALTLGQRFQAKASVAKPAKRSKR